MNRPWGKWEVLKEEPGRKVKLLTVSPGQSLSMQRHFKRREVWLVLEGRGRVTLHGVDFALEPEDNITIEVEAWHQLINDGDSDLVVLEVQEGEECSEDDIERQDEFTFEKRC